MTRFDPAGWDAHWERNAASGGGEQPAHPALGAEVGHLSPGTALDAGCGLGAEARWLAGSGWTVTGADVSAVALAAAADRARADDPPAVIEWLEVDLGRWQSERRWDLVVSHYAHPDTGQLALIDRLAERVAPGGTLLVVAHAPGAGHDHGHGADNREGATATPDQIRGRLPDPEWRIDRCAVVERAVSGHGEAGILRDVIVRATRANPAAG